MLTQAIIKLLVCRRRRRPRPGRLLARVDPQPAGLRGLGLAALGGGRARARARGARVEAAAQLRQQLVQVLVRLGHIRA